MTMDLALKGKALSKAELAAAVGQGQLKRLGNKVNAAEKTKGNLCQKIKLLQKQNHTLEASLMATTKIPALPCPLATFFLFLFCSILVFF
jgi:hypothetical protein